MRYFLSTQVLSNSPSQYILGYEQRTYKQQKAMLDKRHKRVPYPRLKTILPLPLLRTRNIRMNRNPRTRENRDNAAPNNIPNSPTMGEVTARVRLE